MRRRKSGMRAMMMMLKLSTKRMILNSSPNRMTTKTGMKKRMKKPMKMRMNMKKEAAKKRKKM